MWNESRARLSGPLLLLFILLGGTLNPAITDAHSADELPPADESEQGAALPLGEEPPPDDWREPELDAGMENGAAAESAGGTKAAAKGVASLFLLRAATGLDKDGELSRRLGATSSWRGLRATCLWDPDLGEAPRGGLLYSRGEQYLALGGIGGRWPGDLLLGRRRRPGLGSPTSPLSGSGLRASASGDPLLRGLGLGGRLGPLRWRLAAPDMLPEPGAGKSAETGAARAADPGHAPTASPCRCPLDTRRSP